MIIDLEKLGNYDFRLSNINIFHQKPVYREVNQRYRNYNGFLYIIHGKCRYFYGDECFTLIPGSVVYLPISSNHRMIVDSPEIEFYRIDFRLEINQELVLFSKTPLKLCNTAPAELAETIQTLADRYQFVQDTVAKTELMCSIFRMLANVSVNPAKEKLAPAIAYLLEHLTDRIDCHYLAQICSLSTAQFYNIFNAQYGMTPLAYRDSLLMRRATLLLRDGTFSVTEIAEMLGFDSVSYFSRFFKKHRGISPSAYVKYKNDGEMPA